MAEKGQKVMLYHCEKLVKAIPAAEVADWLAKR